MAAAGSRTLSHRDTLLLPCLHAVSTTSRTRWILPAGSPLMTADDSEGPKRSDLALEEAASRRRMMYSLVGHSTSFSDADDDDVHSMYKLCNATPITSLSLSLSLLQTRLESSSHQPAIYIFNLYSCSRLAQFYKYFTNLTT